MTWIPCGVCQTIPCQCSNTWPWPQTYPDPSAQPWVPTVTFPATSVATLTWPTRLTDEDVERVARRVVELLKESK